MTDEERFEAWLAKVCERPLPQNPMGRVRLLAKELAEGASEAFWATGIKSNGARITDAKLSRYLFSRWEDEKESHAMYAWGGKAPHINLLIHNGYVSGTAKSLWPTKAAFDLLEETEPTTIFISYSRDDSSAFALLVLSRLKQHGLEAFLDMALEPGEDWHAGLKERIQQYDYFVVLLGEDTLNSPFVRKEILWALEANLIILPIWHNGFEYNPADWPDLEPEIDEVLRTRHTIRIIEENALAYDGALTELLNRFGVTPE